MTNDSGPKLHFHRSTRHLACFCMLRHCHPAMGLAMWVQLRSRGSINCAMQQHETVVELTYCLALLKSALYFQPDLRYLFWPGGTGRIADAVVLNSALTSENTGEDIFKNLQ
jgi:hypothetical protein